MSTMIRLAVFAIVLINSAHTVVADTNKELISMSPTNKIETVIARMSVRTPKATFTLLELHRKAVKKLRDKYSACQEFFDRASEWETIPTVHVQADSLDKFVELTYGSGLGKPIWAVTFSTAGAVSEVWTGRSLDRVIDQTK